MIHHPDLTISMHILADFLNHGILPFTGRARQLEELIAFWRSAIESPGILLGLLVGEAGSGKSALVDALIPMIAREGGVSVHVKLYPDSTLSLVPLLARALGRTGTATGLLRNAPEENIADVTSALRRLIRLRPTLMVVEDIHLLGNDVLREFARLLQALADEPVALLCPSRPLDTTTQGVLEHYSLHEWHLHGLEHADVRRIWEELFGAPPEDSMFKAVYDATLGNPLALRSALRGILNSGALDRDPQTNLWRLAVTREEFDQALDRSMRLLSEGMAAHLTESERHIAEQLACLGEIFSRDAAAVMDGTGQIIERLMFKGILVVSEVPARPLNGAVATTPPLAFTHTLLHRRLAESATADARKLVEAIASGTPIYSILPFQCLYNHTTAMNVPCDIMEQALERIFLILPMLNVTSDWMLNEPVWQAARRLAEHCYDEWDEEKRLLQELNLLDIRMMIDIRRQHTEEYHRLVHQMLELSFARDTEPFLIKRMRAYANLHMAEFRRNPEKCLNVWNDVEKLLELAPKLRYDPSYPRYLARLLSTSSVVNRDLLTLAEARIEELFAGGTGNEEFMAAMRKLVMPEMLVLFDSREKFQMRLRFLDELENGQDADPYRYLVQRIGLRLYAGRLYELWGMIDGIIRRLEEIAEYRATSYARVVRLFLRAMLGGRADEVQPDIDAMVAAAPEWNQGTLRENLTQYLAAAGLLRGETAWARQLVTQLHCDYPVLDPSEVILYILHDGNLDLIPLVMAEDADEQSLVPILQVLQGEKVMYETLRDSMRAMLREDVYQLFELLRFQAVASSVLHFESTGRYPGLIDELKEDITDMLERWLRWLAGLGIWTLMESLVERYELFLTARQKRAWQGTIATLRAKHGLGTQPRTSDRIRVSMLGTIEIRKPGNEPQRLRGPRISKFLGMLVVDRMLDTPLSFREMCRLISGGDTEADPERERKALNDAVYRLREVLGYDSVITERETSRLNTEVVEVDLLQAHRLLQETMHALREGALARALGLLMNVLEIAGTEVPFPGLYESFFEASRVEFECRLRGALVDLAGRLRDEGDVAGAEELLRRGFAAMPEDEEIMEQLCDVLRSMGRFTEAIRVRMRASDETD